MVGSCYQPQGCKRKGSNNQENWGVGKGQPNGAGALLRVLEGKREMVEIRK